MGKYRAQMSLPNHLFGTIRTYDDEDPVVLHRVSSGMLVRVDGPAGSPARKATTSKGVAKKAPKKAAKKVPQEREPEPSPEPEPEAVADDTTTVEAPSSVMTSWRVAD